MPRQVAFSSSNEATSSAVGAMKPLFCAGCGEFSLVLDVPMDRLPRRPVDNSFCLRNAADSADGAHTKRHFKFNTTAEPQPVLIKREGGYEKQWRLRCPRCELQVGYESADPKKGGGLYTFVLEDAVTAIQQQQR